ncbi:helix-turn-helix domain-containing protein [Clostridium beijerinckii]|uniref:Uncharacterized protein n=1 Tax=Clostridium beijerinckii TaxID=1520 RepID=A0A7X9SMB9_CLOBE|nr:helix-turn-helix domain-containing protein [Clostridium beijerinckii]NMF04537.1 hypothetical protein [Clostridium beijerinckii]
MIENWYALCISILKEVSIDKALVQMNISARNNFMRGKTYERQGSKYSEEFVQQIIQMNQNGMSYAQIGEEYGLTRGQVAGAIRMYKIKKATKEPTKVSEVAMRKNSTSLYHMEGGMQVAN